MTHMRTRIIMLAVFLVAVTIGLSILTNTSIHNAEELHGTWILTKGMALGGDMGLDDERNTSLTFKPNGKMTWRFVTARGVEVYEGRYHADSSALPKKIDLGEPGDQDSGATALGIYKIENEMLTISMGADRPQKFSESAMARLVLKRKKDRE